MRLKYGCNPHQKFASAEPLEGGKMPLDVLNGSPLPVFPGDGAGGIASPRRLEPEERAVGGGDAY